MKISTPLPMPNDEAIQHSQYLQEKIINEIADHEGYIPFSRFMEMALYEPELGYYVAGKNKIGSQGDFVTAPDISPLFSQCMANQCIEVLNELLDGSILEFGAGNGNMAANILLHLEQNTSLPHTYLILDISPHLQAVQRETIERLAPHLLEKVHWITELPSHFNGIVLANEILDAMPVTLFEKTKDAYWTLGVSLDDNQQLTTQKRLASKDLRASLEQLKINTDSSSYISEHNPHIRPWLNSLYQMMDCGVVLLIDYGYTRSEYYHADRTMGTLICHYQQLVHDDYLWFPGLQDITANVDFTAVAEAADNAGLNVYGYTPQASFLIANHLETLLMQALENKADEQYALSQQTRTLTLPSEMGERFKIIGLTKQWDKSLQGFQLNNQLHKL
ncbi:MAG: COG1565: Uncharacterized conserved protein [uncultured Thiotrichaceae bacterium]|uniref:COG1565: Uncharacterized conserved protein n=1 Tax=uncultured Thiotrichaceae bacterium TaxID=298394 RepID=A0A6S6SRR2_9GAMM|nr:MAG: COG1565: Uncharacterized conserved protein [uncultured Thiotrichaceae bacterium]